MDKVIIFSLIGLVLGFLCSPLGFAAIGYWAGGFVIGAVIGGLVGFRNG